jgi:hypothetical protein
MAHQFTDTDISTAALTASLQAAGEDFEWYPTTKRMVDAVAADVFKHGTTGGGTSILDIGAGDGRVLLWLGEACKTSTLYAIEKSTLLQQQQPDCIIPVGAEFIEQDLMSLSVDTTFSNPPYSEYEEWAYRIITTAHTGLLYLILPQRWEVSASIKDALAVRGAKATIIHRDDFLNAERRARAVVHIVRVTFAGRYEEDDEGSYRYRYRDYRKQDPFDLWFDQNINTFDQEKEVSDYDEEQQALARIRLLDSIPEMVDAFNEEYARMEANYKAIFRLDGKLLKELGVNKESVRDGLKKRIKGLKHTYWHGLFDRLDAITSRLTTKTKKGFLERLTGQTAIAFTAANAYAVVLWAIKAANQYLDSQVVDVFLQMATHDGVTNYKSNQRTWERDSWRYNLDPEKHSHFALDYRIVLHHYSAIAGGDSFRRYESPGGLHESCHAIIDDLIAVFNNLGFPTTRNGTPSRSRHWFANQWQNFIAGDGCVLFQVKAFMNGNMHFRFDQRAIRALNIEAGRLLGWLRTKADVVEELAYTPAEADQFFGSNQRLGQSAVRLLTSGVDAQPGDPEPESGSDQMGLFTEAV